MPSHAPSHSCASPQRRYNQRNVFVAQSHPVVAHSPYGTIALTVEQYVSLLGAITALLLAVGTVAVQIRTLHTLVNSRLTELLELTATSSRALGVIDAKTAADESAAAAGEGNEPV